MDREGVFTKLVAFVSLRSKMLTISQASAPAKLHTNTVESVQWYTVATLCSVVAHRETRRQRCRRLSSGSCSTLFISLGNQSETDNQKRARANYTSPTQQGHCGGYWRLFLSVSPQTTSSLGLLSKHEGPWD